MKFDFDEINLIPNKCIVNSRSECDTKVKLGINTFQLPIVPANMECVINETLAIKLAKNGYFYIMHRFDIDVIDFIKNMNSLKLITSISIGVNQDSYDLIDKICSLNLKVDYITIDIAHGHSIKMEKILKYIRNKIPNVFIIAGNVSTIDAVEDLGIWGADMVKVGIGPGCFTPDSLVLTDKGYKSLSEIKEGDNVLTHKNRYRKVVSKQFYIGEQDLIKINNLPACTQTHEFYVIDKVNRELTNESNIEKYAYWIQAKDLDKAKHLIIKKMEFIEIESIEVIEYLGEVIDLTIEEDESYNIEGIIVHNSACTTWPNTGFGSRNCQASTILDCSKTHIPIMADGGIRVPGDITKSLVLGATMVMVGGMLSGFNDSPGDVVKYDKLYKEFWGSASNFQSGKTNRIEGKKILIEYKERSIFDELTHIEECLQSSISYGGGKDLISLINVKWK